MDWKATVERKVQPPIVPELVLSHHVKQALILDVQSEEADVSNFDERFTAQTAVDSPVTTALSSSVNDLFKGFTYGMLKSYERTL